MNRRRIATVLLLVLAGFAVMTYMRQHAIFPFSAEQVAASGVSQVHIAEETTRIVAPLRKDGYIDYLRALNDIASKEVTPANNGVVLLWRVWRPTELEAAISPAYFDLLGISTPPPKGDYFVSVERHIVQAAGLKGLANRKAMQETLAAFLKDIEAAAGHPWSKREYPDLHAWLSENEKPLQRIIAASQCTEWFDPLIEASDSTLLMLARRPALRPIRGVARALCLRATLAIGQEEVDGASVDGAFRDVMACHRLARLVGRGPMFLDAVTAFSLEVMACRADSALLDSVHVTSEQAHAMLAELQQLPPLPDTKTLVDVGERFSCLDAICAMARDGPQAFEQLTDKDPDSSIRQAISSWGFASLDWNLMLEMANNCYDQCAVAESLTTRAARLAARDRIQAELRQTNDSGGVWGILSRVFTVRATVSKRVACVMLEMLISGQTTGDDVADRAVTQSELTLLRFALAAYRADAGHFPETLAALTPRYVSKVPLDVFTGQSLQYQTTDSGYTLESVGLEREQAGATVRGAESD